MNDSERVDRPQGAAAPRGRASAEAGHGIPADAMARFIAAEGRLYPMVLSDPAGYERAALLVGLVATELRGTCPDIASVLQCRAELIGRLPQLAHSAGIDAGALPSDAVVDAASALRCRELQAAADGPPDA